MEFTAPPTPATVLLLLAFEGEGEDAFVSADAVEDLEGVVGFISSVEVEVLVPLAAMSRRVVPPASSEMIVFETVILPPGVRVWDALWTGC